MDKIQTSVASHQAATTIETHIAQRVFSFAACLVGDLNCSIVPFGCVVDYSHTNNTVNRCTLQIVSTVSQYLHTAQECPPP